MTNGGTLDTPAAAVSASNWYRFVVKTSPSANTYSVSIHNQGTARPSPSDADGTLVGTYEGLSFATGAAREATSVALAASGLGAVSPWLADDPDRALIGNLSVAKIPSAFVITLR